MKLLHVASCLVLLGAVACKSAAPIEPGRSTAAFAGAWVGVKRLVSCEPAGPACQFHSIGEETYFSATLNQHAAAVDGSVLLSEPGPLALPYGFTIKGEVSHSAQLTFERMFIQDAGEPPFSGDISITGSPARQLIGRMTRQPSAGDDLKLVWDVEAARR